MAVQTQKKHELPHLVSVDRIFKIPLIDSGYHIVAVLYGKVKHTNGLVAWGFTTAENTFSTALDLTKPTITLFEQPILIVDSLLCKSLDVVEQRVPVINYTPETIYHLTKDYASKNVFQPMIKRAESVKEISFHKANVAAVKLDNVLDIADQYVDKYLPDDDGAADSTDSTVVPADSSNTKKTMVHIKNFRHKLQRRLTHRAIIEAKALKRQGADTLQAILYMADLLARDPKTFFQKVKELWAHLSADEPENQAPPHNLEELIVMLTRESSRRLVHLVNFTSTLVLQRYDVLQHYVLEISHHLYFYMKSSFDASAKKSVEALEQSKKMAELALQKSNNMLHLVFNNGKNKYKELNQILDDFVQHLIKLIERLSRQQQSVFSSPNKVITPPTKKISDKPKSSNNGKAIKTPEKLKQNHSSSNHSSPANSEYSSPNKGEHSHHNHENKSHHHEEHSHHKEENNPQNGVAHSQ